MSVIPSTVDRVRRHTAEDINCRIHQDINDRVRYLAQHRRASTAACASWTKNGTSSAHLRQAPRRPHSLERCLRRPSISAGLHSQRSLVPSCFSMPFRVGARRYLSYVGWAIGPRARSKPERIALKALRGDFGKMGPADGERDSVASHALQAARLYGFGVSL
jgi:hypothetical protein